MTKKPLPSAFLLLLMTSALQAATPVEEMPRPTVPATSIERPENNPAKAAIAARKAQKKDQAVEAAALNGPASENERVVASVAEALRKDSRTADLVVDVSVDGGVVTLNGTVPSSQNSVAAESVAGKVVAPRRVQNNLAVAAK